MCRILLESILFEMVGLKNIYVVVFRLQENPKMTDEVNPYVLTDSDLSKF